MNLELFYKNKVVIVTGSTMGIGKEIARQVLFFGGKVVITGRNLERLNLFEVEFIQWKNNILVHQGDVIENESNTDLVKKTIDKFGKIDVLITNAGLSCFGTVEEMDVNVAKQIIDANIYGSLLPVKAAIPELIKSKGNILFISSVAGFHGLPNYSAYSLSKMSLKALSQSLSIELNSKGVAVGIAYVGFTENENEKKTLSPSGNLVSVPPRSKKLLVSRSVTAIRILKQIMNRKKSVTHAFLGKFTNFTTRYFPRLSFVLIRRNYNKSNNNL